MAHFYADIQGNRGEATRMGTKQSGIGGHIRGWHVGARVSLHFNELLNCDVCHVQATKGSSGYGSEHLADIIEKDNGIQIQLNPKLDKYLSEYDYVQMKEDIASIIFDYEGYANGSDMIEYVRPHEEDCHALAELIMDKLNYKVIQSEDDDDN